MFKEFYSGFKDRVSSVVQKRGAAQPRWEDVLVVSADTYETRAVLSDQGVSPGGLRRDLLYSLHFGRPEISAPAAETIPYRDLYSQAAADLLNDVVTFSESQEFLSDSANQAAATQLVQFLGEYLEDKERVLNDPQGREVAEIKAKILEGSVVAFAEQFSPTFSNPLLSNVPENMQPVVREANRQFTADVLQQFGKYTLEKGKTIATPDQPDLILDVKDQLEAARGGITPFQVIDASQRAADPFIKYLLHRNGLLAPDDYEPPCKMPHPLIIEHGLEALNYAQAIRERAVKPAHLLPSLLQDSTVLHVIMELDEEGRISDKEEPDRFMLLFGFGRGGRNFIKFHAAVQAALAPKREGERFRYQVRATDEIKQFLAKADAVVSEGDETFAEARMLGALITEDQQVKEVLLSAGLTDEQLQKWPEAVAELEKKREEAKKLKPEEGETKSPEEFKISDRQLKDLLDEYSVDLTKLALEGKIDPVIGRNQELYQMMRILLQRGRSNPLLLGESGVGKTTLFDGLAQLIASGRAPKSLIGAKVHRLDLSEMNSGAMFRGQFEERLLPIIQGVAERNARGDKPPIILCIDELHTALMAGTAMGTPGAGELLKPYLTRGELSIIGATTQRDYAKYIAIDTALDRRFQTIFVDEPGYEETVEILKGLKEQYTSHHQLGIGDSLVELAVSLSTRYLPGLKQPDKSIRVLDAALARARMEERETVDKKDLIETIAAEAKIDPKFLMEGEEERYLALREQLPQQVLGQPHATSKIAEALITAKADLQDPRKPLGIFMLFGPTGVGKTETARALSRLLHGSEENLIRIDMSDFMEHHEASKLFGAPPGYVGYGEEGQLTGAVRRQPYSVVVLDEIEKAHPEVLKQFLQIFEEGEKVDGKGQTISFRNTIILMTSNLGAQSAVAEAEAEDLDPQSEQWVQATEPIYNMAAKSTFAPEFLNRIDSVVVYHPLSQEVIGELVQTEVQSLSERITQRYGLRLQITPEVQAVLARDGYRPEYGARELKRVVKNQLTQQLAGWILKNRADLAKDGVIEVTGLGSQFNAEVILFQGEDTNGQK